MNALRRGQNALILFSFDTGPCRRAKASRRIELGGETTGGAFTPAVILFIALPWTDDKAEPG